MAFLKIFPPRLPGEENRLCLKALVFAPLLGKEVVHDGNNGAAQQTQQNTGEHGEDDIGGVVDVQVQPGIGHQERNDCNYSDILNR